MKYQKILEFCEMTIINAWHCFFVGLVVYTLLLAASTVLIIVSLLRRKLSQFIGGALGFILSIFAISLFGNFFPTLSPQDVTTLGLGTLLVSVFAFVFVGVGIFSES